MFTKKGGRPRSDLVGQRFGSLLVVSPAGVNSARNTLWNCRCDCGMEKIICGSDLKKKGSAATKSCGCHARSIASQRPRSVRTPEQKLYDQYRANASRRNIEFELTLEEFLQITSQKCRYCNVAPLQKAWSNEKDQTRRKIYLYNGIDRVDNDLPYSIQNSVPCCQVCNNAKKDMSLGEFLAWAERLSIFRYNKLNDLRVNVS